jgi:hypothetical protein
MLLARMNLWQERSVMARLGADFCSSVDVSSDAKRNNGLGDELNWPVASSIPSKPGMEAREPWCLLNSYLVSLRRPGGCYFLKK